MHSRCSGIPTSTGTLKVKVQLVQDRVLALLVEKACYGCPYSVEVQIARDNPLVCLLAAVTIVHPDSS